MNKALYISDSESLIKRDEKSFERLVNIIAYIVQIDKKTLSLTRLLKYLYIIDETSVKTIGVPVTNLEYKVADNGPLADLLRVCLLKGNSVFKKYFKTSKSLFVVNMFTSETNQKCDIESLVEKPNLDLLSRYEIRLINEVVDKYRGVDTNEIIDELHAEGTLWHNIMTKYKIDFRHSVSKVSEYKINFEELIANDEINSESFRNYKVFQS